MGQSDYGDAANFLRCKDISVTTFGQGKIELIETKCFTDLGTECALSWNREPTSGT